MAMLEQQAKWAEEAEKSWAKPVLTFGLIANLIFAALQVWFASTFVTKASMDVKVTEIEHKIDTNAEHVELKIDRIYYILLEQKNAKR